MPFKNAIEAQIRLRGVSKHELADFLGITVTTLHRKIVCESEFTLREMKILQDILEFDDPTNIFFEK